MFDDSEVDPSVDFLYKTMLSRDPNKRRVKPVQKHLVQVEFAGLDDSDEDSDFDITEELEVSDDSEIFSNENISEEKPEKAESIVSISDGDIEILDEEPSIEKQQPKSMPYNCADEPVEIEDEDDEDDDGDNESMDDVDDDEDDEEDDEDDISDDEDSDDDDDDDEDEDETSSPVEKSAFSHHLMSMDISDDEDDTDYVPKKMRRKKKKDSNIPDKKRISSPEETPAKPVSSSTPYEKPKNLKVVICCVCLGDISQNEDEIVECDNCGVSVHEGCYGVNESQSAASTESSASTEPWFCDSCKAGVTPQCELCPNEGGIYKETDAGKWVHLVCALYTPGVAFGDVDRLSPVTLFEMPYSRWASKECSLCEDPRFSRTGVCIGCDAGMCRIYFHVTCAQREGLLSEASPEEVMDIADPFFAYCKMHADKNMMRIKRRNWLAVQSRVKKHVEQILDDEKEKIRFNRKLNRHREKYRVSRANRQPSWVPTQKMARFLHSCPSAVKRMLKKAELMGIVTSVQHESHEKQESRKKSYISPAFTSEFIAYFLERNVKMENLRSSAKDLELQSKKLYEQEKVLRTQYDKLCAEIDKLKESSSKKRKEGEKIWNVISDVSRKPVSVPEILRPKKIRSPTRRDVPLSPPAAVIHQCGICKKTNDQHMLAKCDECKLYYHLGCLEPPLTRLPKKTKLFGWQCSRCAKIDTDEPPESKNLDCDAPRQLREKRRMPFKFTPPHIQEYNFKMMTSKSKKKTTTSQNIKKQIAEPIQKTSEEEKKIPYAVIETPVTSHKSSMKGPPAKPVKKLDKMQLSAPTPLSRARPKTPPPTLEPAHATRSLRRKSGMLKIESIKQEEPPAIEKIKSTSFSVSQMVSQIVQSVEEEEQEEPQDDIVYCTPSIGSDSYLTECIICSRPGKNNVNMVRCDECKLFYHFLCLIPPVRKNPKPRGYTWHCEACDQTELMESEKENGEYSPPTKVSPKTRTKQDRRPH